MSKPKEIVINLNKFRPIKLFTLSNFACKMKTIALFILFSVCISLVSAQEWVDIINSPNPNYYNAKRAFIQWKDSMERFNERSNLYKIFNKKKIEEIKEITMEAHSRFCHWDFHFSNEMDERGYRLPDHTLRKRFFDGKFYTGSSKINAIQGNWISRGPEQVLTAYGSTYGVGRVNNLAIHPIDSNILYVGMHGSGLWKSTDEGANWILLSDSLAHENISMLAIDPNNGNKLFKLASGELKVTTDGGITWSNTSLKFNTSSVNGKILFDPINSQTIFLQTLTLGLFRSLDGGISWDTLISGQTIFDIEFNNENSSSFFLLFDSKILKSTDGGLTFDTTMLPSTGYSYRDLAIAPTDSNYIYAYSPIFMSGGYVAKSTDGGNTFVLQPNNTNLSNFSELHTLIVSPLNKEHLIMGGIGLSSSINGGISFTTIANSNYQAVSSLPYVHVDHRDLQFKGTSLWSANDGDLVKSTDFGLTWQRKSLTLPRAYLYKIASCLSDTSKFISASLDCSILSHADTGWVNIFSGDGFDVAVSPVNPQFIFGKSQYGYQRSYDGGKTLTPNPFSGLTESLYGFGVTGFPIKFNTQNPSSLYLLAKNVWKSTNNGDSVTKISNFTNFSGGGFLYVCDIDSNIIFTRYYRTTDGGLNWKKMDYNIMTVDPDEPEKVWATGLLNGYTTVFYSSDTGNTWTEIPSYDITFVPSHFMRCANNSTDGVYLVTDFFIYYRDSQLSNWQPFINGLPKLRISDMEVLSNFSTLRISTFGIGVWQSSSIFNYSLPPVADFVYDKDSICPGDSIRFFDNSLNNGPGYNPVYIWNFPGGNPSASSDPNPVIVYSLPGYYSVSLKILNSNGTDSVTKSMLIYVSYPPLQQLPFLEGFEGSIYPPAGWNWNINNGSTIWTKNFQYGGYAQSNQSLLYSIINSDSALMTDYVIMPQIDLSTLPSSPAIFYDYCYPYNYVFPDTLRLFYTTDCGKTKFFFYTKGGLDLKTDSINGLFYYNPTASAWKTDTISLLGLPSGNLQIGFFVESRERAQIYIDNINITSVPLSGSNEIIGSNLNIDMFPNPAYDMLKFYRQMDQTPCVISIYNVWGELVYSQTWMTGKRLEVSILTFDQGFYVVKLLQDGKSYVKKLLIAR